MKLPVAKLILILAVIAIVFRLAFLLFTLQKVPISSDEALPSLMAMHILKGEFPVIYWGQAYMGTLESYFEAPCIYLLGPKAISTRIFPFFFSLVFLLFSYLLARRVYDRETGALTLLLLAIPAPYLAMSGALPPDPYMALIALGTITLYLTHVLAYGNNRNCWLYIALGAVMGFSFWMHLLFIVYLGVALLFLFLKDKLLVFRWRFWTLAAAFLITASPFLWYNWRYDFISFNDVGQTIPLVPTIANIKTACTFTIQFLLGMKVMLYGDSVHTRSLPAFLAYLLGAIWTGMLLAVLWLKRKHLGRVCLLSLKNDDGTVMLVAMAAAALVVFGHGARSGLYNVRYLLPVMSALPILMACGLRQTYRWFKPLFYGMAGLVVLCQLWGNVLMARAWSDPAIMAGPLELPDTRPLIQFLRTQGIRHAYTHYWLSYRLSFETGESIMCAEPYNERFPGYDVVFIDEVRQAPKVAFITYPTLGIGANGFENLLKGIGGAWQKTNINCFTVFYDFKPPCGDERTLREIPRDRWQVTASIKSENTPLIFDGKTDTVWTSETAQTPGMTVTVDMGAVHPLAKIRFDLGDSLCDFQRGSKIEVSADNQRWQTAFEYGDVAGGLFWDNNQPQYLVRGDFFTCTFAPVTARYVRITQTGSDPHFWWTIAELRCFGPPS